jgi:hypothetical protein
VKVTDLEVEGGTVTFKVSWDRNEMPEVWVDSAWVFVDYNNNGVMTRLPLIAGATLTETSAPGNSSVEYAPNNNNQGVWVVGNAKTASSGSFSAKVKLLTEVQGVAGACAYASNYPPVGEYTSATNISFTGTAPYAVVLKNSSGGTIIQEPVGSPYVFSSDYTVQSFTDKTGAPGRLKCIPMAWYGIIDFSAPDVPKEQLVYFSVAESPSIPGATLTYSWLAEDFNPDTGAGTPFSTTAPASSGAYPVTLTAHSEDYCDLSVTKNVQVVECAGRLGDSLGQVCPDNNGGRIGNGN